MGDMPQAAIAATERAAARAAALDDQQLAEQLRSYADDIAADGRAYVPAFMREAASRLVAQRNATTERDAARYRYLRERDLDTIEKGGIFAGRTPDNVVVNGDDLDAAIDAALGGA